MTYDIHSCDSHRLKMSEGLPYGALTLTQIGYYDSV